MDGYLARQVDYKFTCFTERPTSVAASSPEPRRTEKTEDTEPFTTEGAISREDVELTSSATEEPQRTGAVSTASREDVGVPKPRSTTLIPPAEATTVRKPTITEEDQKVKETASVTRKMDKLVTESSTVPSTRGQKVVSKATSRTTKPVGEIKTTQSVPAKPRVTDATTETTKTRTFTPKPKEDIWTDVPTSEPVTSGKLIVYAYICRLTSKHEQLLKVPK